MESKKALLEWIYTMTDPETLQSAEDMQNALEEIRDRIESYKEKGFDDTLASMKGTVNGIFKAFGIENGYGEIDMKTDAEWDMNNESVRWVEGEDRVLYSNDIIGDPHYHLDYVLIYVDNNSGDKFWQVFKMSKRNTELED